MINLFFLTLTPPLPEKEERNNLGTTLKYSKSTFFLHDKTLGNV